MFFVDIDFNATYAQDWFDPINWCSTDNETGACAQRPLLDTESIPCQNDDVIFPRRTSFFTNVETNQNIKINTLKISGVVSKRVYVCVKNARNEI